MDSFFLLKFLFEGRKKLPFLDHIIMICRFIHMFTYNSPRNPLRKVLLSHFTDGNTKDKNYMMGSMSYN